LNFICACVRKLCEAFSQAKSRSGFPLGLLAALRGLFTERARPAINSPAASSGSVMRRLYTMPLYFFLSSRNTSPPGSVTPSLRSRSFSLYAGFSSEARMSR